MFNRTNCDRKSQISGILTKALNQRAVSTVQKIEKIPSYYNVLYLDSALIKILCLSFFQVLQDLIKKIVLFLIYPKNTFVWKTLRIN